MPRTVLIIEDEPDIAEVLRYALEKENFEIRHALTGEEGLSASLDTNHPPAIILLDLLLPGMQGTEICRRLRSEPATVLTPIVIMTAKTSEADLVAGLELGANDYVTKPFSVRAVTSRIHALLSYAETNIRIYEDDKLKVDFLEQHVSCGGVPVRLTSIEFALLAELVTHPGAVASQQRLIDKLWSKGHYSDLRKLEIIICRLRASLGSCGEMIETVGDIGYRFTSVEAPPASVAPGTIDEHWR